MRQAKRNCNSARQSNSVQFSAGASSMPARAHTPLPCHRAVAEARQSCHRVFALTQAFAQTAGVAKPEFVACVARHAGKIDEEPGISAAVRATRTLRRSVGSSLHAPPRQQQTAAAAVSLCRMANLSARVTFPG